MLVRSLPGRRLARPAAGTSVCAARAGELPRRLHAALQRQGPQRLEGARRRQRPLEGRRRRHRLRRPERGARARRTSGAQSEYGDFVLHVDWRIKETPYMNPNVPIIRPTARTRRARTARRSRSPCPTPTRASTCAARARRRSTSGAGRSAPARSTATAWTRRCRPRCAPASRRRRTPTSDVGQWNAFEITMQGDRLTVVLNGVTVIENAQLPGRARTGPIALQHHGAEEGRRVDQPAGARAVPQHRDQGAEVAPRHVRHPPVEGGGRPLRGAPGPAPGFFRGQAARAALPPELRLLRGHEARRPQQTQVEPHLARRAGRPRALDG